MQDHVGIAGVGTYLPKRYMTAKELASLTGIDEAVIVDKFGVKGSMFRVKETLRATWESWPRERQ